MKALAIIAARGGSKRIPRKNIRMFLDKPALCWPIDAAKDSGCFDTVMVSTDDAIIADTARNCGTDVPFLRSAEGSGDHATLADVLREVLQTYAARGEHFDIVGLFLATAFFADPAMIRSACRDLEQDVADVVMPVLRFPYPVQRALKKDHAGFMGFMHPEHALTRSQDLEQGYYDSGQYYLLKTASFAQSGNIIAGRVKGLEIPWYSAVDVDEEEDWLRAEQLAKAFRKR
ncbi:MAG: pseudaminic acid cytidylyltransferase [Bacteroidetes bacterium]|nr:pseudaminic acid cytidylyltransferase [Bacteroidota bacterium]